MRDALPCAAWDSCPNPAHQHSAENDAPRTTCLVAVWDDGIYRTRCSMGTKGRCFKHGPHQPHPIDGRPCEPNPHDDYCHTHGVYMDPYRVIPPAEGDS